MASQPGNPLPVTLLFFTARPTSLGVVLTWATATELDFDYFRVERSANGISFNEVARISGQGNSISRVDYTFKDEHPFVGRSYYRLVSVDMDGSEEIFDVATVQHEGAKELRIYPNPVADRLVNLEFNFAPGSEATVSIIDLNGVEVVRKRNLSIFTGLNLTIPPGTYLVKATDRDFVRILRLVVE